MNIKKASELAEVSADTIRYYEKIELIPAIKRSQGGIRVFDEQDIRSIKFAVTMRKVGLSIEKLRKYLALFREGDETIQERKIILSTQVEALKENIAELTETLEYLEYKLENYEEHLKPFENSLRH